MHKWQKGKQTHSQTVEVADAPKWAGFSQLREKKLRQEISQREGPSSGGTGDGRRTESGHTFTQSQNGHSHTEQSGAHG